MDVKANHGVHWRNGRSLEENTADLSKQRATGGRQSRPRVIVTDRRKHKLDRASEFVFSPIRDDHRPQRGRVARSVPLSSVFLLLVRVHRGELL
jgi:hypothetical protein